MSSSAEYLAPPSAADAGGSRGQAPVRDAEGLWPWPVWVAVLALVIGLAVLIVLGTGMTPSFDPYGWLVWGHQILHGRLDLNAAPSWKPLTSLFTLPYALFSEATAPKLWSITAVAGTLSMSVFAGRIAYRLARPAPAERTRRAGLAAWVGALLAAAAPLGLQRINHLAFIANSDPLNTALVLAAVDAHLSRRPRLAHVMLCLAALGRPEAWPFVGLYALWLMWKVPKARLFAVALGALVLAAWFVPSEIWSKSLFQAGNLDLGKSTACTGGALLKAGCVTRRWADLYEWPMQVAAVLGVAIALLRRNRAVLVIAGLSVLWVVVEIAEAIHGFSAVYRYLLEPGALMLPLAGYALAELIAGLPRLRPARLLTLAGPLAALGILVALVPVAHHREFNTRSQISAVRNYGVRFAHLQQAVARAGGRGAILACGEVASLNQYQSQLAYAMALNVSSVYFNPPLLLRVHRRVVIFTQVGLNGWTAKPDNVPGSLAGRCDREATVTIPSS